MKNKVLSYRLEQNMTQTELAEKARLSLRTIQRIEAGTTPRGHTLRSIANAFGTSPETFVQNEELNLTSNRIKLINLSALSFLIIPFGNIILPSLLTYKTKNVNARSVGKDIISTQIIWSITTSILMIISPFLQVYISLKIPLFIIILVLLISLNVLLILRTGIQLSRNSNLYMSLKFSIL